MSPLTWILISKSAKSEESFSIGAEPTVMKDEPWTDKVSILGDVRRRKQVDEMQVALDADVAGKVIISIDGDAFNRITEVRAGIGHTGTHLQPAGTRSSRNSLTVRPASEAEDANETAYKCMQFQASRLLGKFESVSLGKEQIQHKLL